MKTVPLLHLSRTKKNSWNRFNIPRGLKEIGVPEDCVDRIAEKSMVDTAFGTNPIKADLDDVRKLVIESINKAR